MIWERSFRAKQAEIIALWSIHRLSRNTLEKDRIFTRFLLPGNFPCIWKIAANVSFCTFIPEWRKKVFDGKSWIRLFFFLPSRKWYPIFQLQCQIKSQAVELIFKQSGIWQNSPKFWLSRQHSNFSGAERKWHNYSGFCRQCAKVCAVSWCKNKIMIR